MTEVGASVDLSLPSQDTVSWHHLSKEQVMKGILRQLHEGRIPSPVIFLIWNEIKRSLKADEDLTRSYHSSVPRRWQNAATWISRGPISRTTFLESIQMVGTKEFLQASYPSPRREGPANIRSKCRYLRDRGHYNIMSDYNYFMRYGGNDRFGVHRMHRMRHLPNTHHLGELYVEENWPTIEAMSFGCLHLPERDALV